MSLTLDTSDTSSHENTDVRPYRPLPNVYDEMCAPDGSIRPHWQSYIEASQNGTNLPPAERTAKLNAIVRETGIAHNLFADPSDDEQPWSLDPVPLILSLREWEWLQTALCQRARLFNKILEDLYGPQQLLASGDIPPALIFSDYAFLRALHGAPPEMCHLRFYAADIARGPDGLWRVIDNHAETPAGPGFAIANRITFTHSEGDLFRQCNVYRLAPFFEDLQEDLVRTTNREDPTIALLTPGPTHDDYFGHAYLSRYLGHLLVEGGDLVVKESRVYLKTLEGLQHIDILVRSAEGAFCDPLELNPSGFLAPVGLVEANRANPNLVSNGLGAALIENRALAGFLPNLCEKILGETLMLHDAPRQWLGSPSAQQNALKDLDRLVVRNTRERTARPGRAIPGLSGTDLSPQQRLELAQNMRLHGKTMVAEQVRGLATTPRLDEHGLAPSHSALRLYTAKIGGDYRTMPGGLAMTVEANSASALSAPKGESRDVWVVSENKLPSHTSRLRPSLDTISFHRTGLGLQSRVADNLYWLGRYTERAEWTMRLVRCVLARLEEESNPEDHNETVTSALMVWLTKDPGAPMALGGAPTPDDPIMTKVQTLIYGPERTYGLQTSLENVHRLSALTRDRLSLEAWRILNSFFLDKSWHKNLGLTAVGKAIDQLDDSITTLAAFSGMAMENMTRNFSWRFLDMGRRLERAINLTELMLALFDKKLEEDTEQGRLTYVLELADSIMTYRARYRMAPVFPAVLDLLLIDETNPRAVSFQLAATMSHIGALAAGTQQTARPEPTKMILQLLTQMRLADPLKLGKPEEDGIRQELRSLLKAQIDGLQALSDEITRTYFLLDKETPHTVTMR